MFFILGGCGLVNMYKIWNEKEEELFYVLEGKICYIFFFKNIIMYCIYVNW